MSLGRGWIGVDLDGTLAHYDRWRGSGHVGEPVPAMLNRVRTWLEQGKDVRIFTARVSPGAIALNGDDETYVRGVIENWCKTHIGQRLPITHEKDMALVELWDDRAVQVIPNTGVRADGKEL